MKTYQLVVKTENEFKARICDICGRSTKEEGNWRASIGSSDFCETTISIEEGNVWPEDSMVEVRVFDICPECFKTKLIPFLESLGAKGRIYSY